jgi:hypothetical protein
MRDLRTIFLPRHFLCLMEAMTAVGPRWSQQAAVAPTDTTTLHVASRLVVLDVVVLDRNGKFVSNLDRSQFTVIEDKVPQAIRSFDQADGARDAGGYITP